MPSKEILPHQIKRLNEIRTLILTWRTNEGLSQREFADLADIHFNTIYNLERDHSTNAIHSMTLLTLLNCIDAMGMSLSEFFAEMV